jgi:D-glutamate cyclase
VNEQVARIEAIIGRKVKRDISQMTDWARGNLARAAEAIASTPKAHVGIVTGFYIKHAEPPSPETDGLIGMAHLAAGLANAGIEVTVITDAPCAKAVWAVVDALPVPVNLEVVSVAQSSVERLRKHLESRERPMTHLIAIERVSPGSDGKPHREHGWDMSRETAPLHLLFDAATKGPWYTIGIGDGGNEIGMGSLPKEIIETSIPNGQLIAATTAVDSLIVAGVSNWGGYGLLAAMACVKPALRDALLHYFNREMDHRFLSAAVETGQAVDDSRVDHPGRPQMSVDRIPWEQHATLLEEIAAAAQAR